MSKVIKHPQVTRTYFLLLLHEEERYRDLERLLAIEQAEENGFDQLETARDLLIPPDFSLAREYENNSNSFGQYT